LLKNRRDIAQMSLINIGDIYLHQKNYDSAFYYYKKVETFETIDSWQKTQLKRSLAKYQLALHNLDEAEKLGLEALILAEKIESKWEISENLHTLSEVAFEKKLFEKAYLLKQREQKYEDSINVENRVRKIKYLLFQKKEQENHQLSETNKAIQTNLSRAIIVLIIIVLLFVFSLSLLLLYRKNLKNKIKFNNELNEKNERISSQNSNLEETLATKTKILSIISHDMKSPLAAIKQVLMMYNDSLLTREEQDSLLKKLLIQVESSIEMLNNLVFWPKKQAQGIKVNKVAISPIGAIKEIIQYNKIILELKSIDVNLSTNGFERTKAIIDPDQFQIICQNLLGNSIKYSYNGSEILIQFTETEKMLCIHFKDYGLGMDAEKIAEILSKNTKIKSRIGTNDEKGSGLGLILVQSLLELNDGFLEIKSEPNQGSELIVNVVKAI
jgi:signal transduction histidine kinase